MPSGCARLPSCRGRKGDVPVKQSASKPVAAGPKAPAAKPGAAKAVEAPGAAKESKKGKAKKGGPPPAAAAFLARKKAEEEAAAAAAAEAGSEASGDEGQQSDDHSGGEHEEISLAFDTFGPAQEDCEGIEGCVAGMLDGREFDCRGLTELIIRQAVELGMVVKIVGEDEVYGVMSVADMSQSSVASLREIGDFIVDKCPESSRALFESAVKGKTGLVINERPTGTPPGLALPLLTSLLDEIKEAQTGQYKKLRDKYAVGHFLILTKAARPPPSNAAAGDADVGQPGAAGAGGGGVADGAEDDVVWQKVEDEAFSKCACASFEYPLAHAPRDDSGCVTFGKVMLVKADQMDAVRQTALDLLGSHDA
eukprot:Tamp_14770.p1 GENE.Tamp_14770~~Tamp_14770.p1  ORF type:complete len:388 (+),score=106.26 Tamp_14770:69-1166(+)